MWTFCSHLCYIPATLHCANVRFFGNFSDLHDVYGHPSGLRVTTGNTAENPKMHPVLEHRSRGTRLENARLKKARHREVQKRSDFCIKKIVFPHANRQICLACVCGPPLGRQIYRTFTRKSPNTPPVTRLHGGREFPSARSAEPLVVRLGNEIGGPNAASWAVLGHIFKPRRKIIHDRHVCRSTWSPILSYRNVKLEPLRLAARSPQEAKFDGAATSDVSGPFV